MGLLELNNTEYDYYISSYCEALNLIGQDAYLYSVDLEGKDLYRDPTLNYNPAVKVRILFESNPQPILRKQNWLTEDEDLPYVAYILGRDSENNPVEVTENMKVRVFNRLGKTFDRLFNVERVNLNHLNEFIYICKLTPYRERVSSVNNEEKKQNDTGFSYLDIHDTK